MAAAVQSGIWSEYMAHQDTPQYGQHPAGRRMPSPGQAGRGAPDSGRREPVRSRGPSTGGPQREPPRNSRRELIGDVSRWVRAVVMVLATITLCIILAIFAIRAATDFTGINQVDQTIPVEIPEDATNAEVAEILKEEGVIQFDWVFKIFADLKTKDAPILPGSYLFNSNLGYNEIMVALRSGDYEKQEVRVTFIEGETLREIADKLEEKNVCESQAFLDYLETAEFDYEFFNAMPESDLRYHRLEGYIFPDTYDFYIGESVQDVARKFIRNFNEKITPDIQAKMRERNLSVDEAITLASMIQKEAGKVEDMRMVSSVFHNRLSLSETYPNLQSDVTVFYVNNEIKPFLQTTNQEMYDAYNTYVCERLPVGPICNPGMDAINAALNPVQSENYFFVTDKNQEFYYAQTADEHYQNVRKAKAVGGEAHGIATQED